AAKFEPSQRCEGLDFWHHREVAKLEPQEATAMLSRAQSERWSVRDLRDKVLAHRVSTGAYTPLPNDDPDAKYHSAMQSAWNNAPRHVKEYWLPLFVESNFGLIDA
ncbi:MAG: hypothetical protein ACRCVX_16815, partial [Shewanella sp.]